MGLDGSKGLAPGPGRRCLIKENLDPCPPLIRKAFQEVEQSPLVFEVSQRNPRDMGNEIMAVYQIGILILQLAAGSK